jgi:hypothetical protein
VTSDFALAPCIVGGPPSVSTQSIQASLPPSMASSAAVIEAVKDETATSTDDLQLYKN